VVGNQCNRCWLRLSLFSSPDSYDSDTREAIKVIQLSIDRASAQTVEDFPR
jgi:hypothetical protein